MRRLRIRDVLACGVATVVIAGPLQAGAQTIDSADFSIAAQPLASALIQFGMQSGRPIIAPAAITAGKTGNTLRGKLPIADALRELLRGSGLSFERSGNGFRIVQLTSDNAGASTGGPEIASTAVASNDIVVTAQRRSEAIQDVPIAISAFTQQSLDKQKIEGGPDLLKAIPNVTFSKSNFAGFNLSIRGIGTKALSASTDPGVAIDFNSTTLINNRFFEQEFFDLERVEVLRGPQGTLYGRNATGGVVNIISAKPVLNEFGGYLKVEGGNYDTKRAQGAINIPIVDDILGVRLAGAITRRSGFTRNDLTGNDVDGRRLYTTRFSAAFKPASRYRADFVWERFYENDTRARTAKQLCHRDDGPESLGALQNLSPQARGYLSQGCKPGSLYEDDAYGVPNGLSLPYVLLAQQTEGGVGLGIIQGSVGDKTILQPNVDPYAGTTQIRDRRRFSAAFDPRYRATANLLELNQTWDVTDGLSLISQTAYNQDDFFSTQDYNRFATVPVLTATDENDQINISPGGFFNDPQLGRSNRLLARDLVTSATKQFSQELRIATTGNGPLQFTAGGNYTYYRNSTDYFVFINALTLFAQVGGFGIGNGSVDPRLCRGRPIGAPGTVGCIYVDPNPINNLDRDGHNYFRSVNRYTLRSFGAFADGTYAITPNFKLIAGIRYNDDRKTTTPIPSQLLLARNPELLGGTVDRGYPANPDIRQNFTALTGRAGVQWKPELGFTDDSLIYATYSRGYKGGGTNPPPVGFAPGFLLGLQSFAPTFRPEYVNAFELGLKNTFLNNRLTVNLTGFYYDFTDYQVSQVVDRSAVNENFDTEMYGLEFETVFQPFRNLTLNANAGYQRTRIKDGSQSIDVLNRTQDNPDFVVVKPFAQVPSNCVVSRAYVEQVIADNRANGRADEANLIGLCPGNSLINGLFGVTAPAEALANGGIGFYDQLGGNELPNAPRLTLNVGVEYNVPIVSDWVLTPRVDYYRQSSSWARVYNSVNDRLRGWQNVNASLRFGNPALGILVEAYVKNVFNTTPITDTFINSDDTGLTTNIFTYDPRTIGLNVTKRF